LRVSPPPERERSSSAWIVSVLVEGNAPPESRRQALRRPRRETCQASTRSTRRSMTDPPFQTCPCYRKIPIERRYSSCRPNDVGSFATDPRASFGGGRTRQAICALPSGASSCRCDVGKFTRRACAETVVATAACRRDRGTAGSRAWLTAKCP